MKNKADRYKLSKPNDSKKPREFDPEKVPSDMQKEMYKIWKAQEEYDRKCRNK